MKLAKFLSAKPLYYAKIDYERMPRAFEAIKPKIAIPKTIHIVGTNGKGTTGRFLAHYLFKSGFKTGHYSSPHILKFNERIWLDGRDVPSELLEVAHQKLLGLLPRFFWAELSYFEYTTLLALVAMQECDFIVFEAGLGGEFDATNVVPKILSLITPIDFDHRDFLGDTIEKIALTKLRSIQNHAILARQPHGEVYEIARRIAKEKGATIHEIPDLLLPTELIEIREFIAKKRWASYLADNLALAMAAARFLGLSFDLARLENVQFFGRFQKILPNVTIDVGHNELAARAVAREFEGKKLTLVYNSFKDKDFKAILEILKPIVREVLILPVSNERIVDRTLLEKSLNELGLSYGEFRALKDNEEYLVFGSFSVVESFLKRIGWENLAK